MINGMINIKKEQGYTSHDVVAKLRGIVGQRKIGHTGTLDPDATGVLPVCLGKATKLCDMLTDKNKTYEAVLLLGVETDTQDITGTVLEKKEVKDITESEVEKMILSFVGKYDQIPPMYSALKVDGKKLYELAREGKVIERKPRPVEIMNIHILSINLPEVRMSVTCSKGTYIRTLCHDIGQKLHLGGCMKSLIRTRVSNFRIEEALTLKEVQELKDKGTLRSCVMPVDYVFTDMPMWILPEELQWLAYNGNQLKVSEYLEHNELKGWLEGSSIRVYDICNRFVGVYKYQSKIETLKLEKMFLDKEDLLPRSAITLGKFDGFHRGHQKLLDKVVACSQLESITPVESTVFAFDMLEFKKSHHMPSEQLMVNDEKEAFLEGRVQRYEPCEFVTSIRTMRATKFISEIIVKKYRAKYIVVGSDFRFGFEAQGDVELLKSYAQIHDYEVVEVEKETYGGREISSSYIKEELLKGNLEDVNAMLGYDYSVSGYVIKGKQLGRRLGFPTMNVKPSEDKILPPSGVYVVEVLIEGVLHQGIANVGTKPTVDSREELLVESYVFDYNEDSYDKHIQVQFKYMLRREEKFQSVDLLKVQVHKDIETAKLWFVEQNKTLQ